MASICCSPPLRLPACCVAALAETGEHLEPVLDVLADLGAVLADVGAGLEVVLDASARGTCHGPGARGRRPWRTIHSVGLPTSSRAVEDHRALGVDHAAQRPDRGGLAGAVGTEQHHDLALVRPRSRARAARRRGRSGACRSRDRRGSAAPTRSRRCSRGRPRSTLGSFDTSAGVPSAILRPKFEHHDLVGDRHDHLHVVLDEQHGQLDCWSRSWRISVGQLVDLGCG